MITSKNNLTTVFYRFVFEGDGELYTTGNNECGQLGAKSRELQLLPIRVAALDTYTISHVACGQKHTVAVTGIFFKFLNVRHVNSLFRASRCNP